MEVIVRGHGKSGRKGDPHQGWEGGPGRENCGRYRRGLIDVEGGSAKSLMLAVNGGVCRGQPQVMLETPLFGVHREKKKTMELRGTGPRCAAKRPGWTR